MNKNNYDVIIIGAGLAGLSCGLELVLKGKKVLLLEAEKQVGGRTSSWNDNGMHVESGLHRWLGFYSALPKLIDKAGLSLKDIIVWEDEVEIRVPQGPHAVFGASLIRKPFKTLVGALGNNQLISWNDKFSFVKFLLAGIKDYATRPEWLDQQTVLDYAKKHRVTRHTIDRVLTALTAGVFFIPPEQYSAYALFGLLVPYWPHLYRSGLGAFRGGMTEVMAAPIAQSIEKHGGTVRTDSPVQSLVVEENRVTGVCVNNKNIYAEHVVIATAITASQKLVKEAFGKHPDFQQFLWLKTMSAVTVQIELDQPALPVDRTTFGPLTHISSFAEQSRTTFTSSKGRLSTILSPADPYLDKKDEELLQTAVDEAKKLDIDLESHIKNFRVVKHPGEFYALIPGTEEQRPRQKTSIEGLVLAGDYTKQPFLATMEGAVISGQRAAEIILS